MNNQWWLRTQDEVFGPVSRENLLEWAVMGRIQPGQDVSCDGENWMPATDVDFLDMRWSIDIGDGLPRGPFNKRAAQALLASGRLPEGSKLVESVRNETPCDDADSAATDELRRQLEVLKTGLHAAEARAEESEKRVADVQSQLAAMQKQAVANEARALDAEARAKEAETRADKAEKRVNDAESCVKDAETRAEKAEKRVQDAQNNEVAYEGRIKSLSDEIKRLPPTAQLAADAQAAVYALMREEADELAAALDAEQKEAERFRQYRRERTERLLARRQEILRHIGTDAEDMTRRALVAHPEDPRTVHMRRELEALRILQERSAAESERKVRDLSVKLRDSMGEVKQLREQAADVTVIYRQLQETREKLMMREKELVEERQRAEAERQQHAAAQQALLTRLSSLEMGMPGTTNQSREAHKVRLAPWMGLKK